MIGLATIGQAPREDVIASMFPMFEPVDIVQAGALDGLSQAEIGKLAPMQGEHPLVTRLNDRSEVVISKESVTPLLNDAIFRLESMGATLVCVLCTGEFRGLRTSIRIVYPDAVLSGVVDAFMPTGHLGVLIPHSGQHEQMRGKWHREGREAHLTAVSPYGADGRFADAAIELASLGAELIVMDCMGYDVSMQSEVQAAVNIPIILANRTVGALLDSMLPGLTSRCQDAG